jgi:NAD+ kinase
MEFIRRTSIKPEKIFTQPLIVYKWNLDQAHECCLKIVEYLLHRESTKYIFLEDLNKVNIEILSKYLTSNNMQPDYEVFKKNESKLKKFDVKGEIFPDLCIVIGGDGTTLWTNHLFENTNKPPFLNFNLGTLGYMSIYNCELYKEILDELYSPNKVMTFEKRATLKTSIMKLEKENVLQRLNTQEFKLENANEKCILDSLNDVVIEKTNGANCICLKVYFNDEPLNEIRSDGIIIATPTGSTAYNLSAGGAVIHYDVDAMILNSICPMSLSFRCVAFPRDVRLKFVPCQTSVNKVLVNSDGNRQVLLGPDEYVETTLSQQYVHFIILEKFVKNRANLWKKKIVNQLGWNTAFKNE